MFTVHFIVSVTEPYHIHDNEFIFVVGSHEVLGNWDPKKALKLKCDEKGQFVGTVSLNGSSELKFRYFIGYYLQSELNREPALIVYKWETHRAPRSLLPAVEATKTRVCRANVNDFFGFCGGKRVVSDGWLSNVDENEIHLTITGTPLKFYKSEHVEDNYRFRITPLDLRNKHDKVFDDCDVDDVADATLPQLPSHSATEIATLSGPNPRFHAQNACGEPFKNDFDYFVFRTRSVAVEYLGFRIDVLSPTKNRVIAVGYALPSTVHDTYGKASAPLLSGKGLPVGKFYFRYLFICALSTVAPEVQRMDVSYARHWKKRTTLEVGHRGMGNSYTKCAVARENTLHSLNSAAKNGADLVEFDVHLTKDKVPIVYHDFHVMVSVAKRSSSVHDGGTDSGALSDAGSVTSVGSVGTRPGVDFYQLAVKDLKLNQLKLLHLDHIAHANSVENISEHKVTGEVDEEAEHLPFPTLVEAFQNVCEDVGFNVEIKFPLWQINGQSECENYFERNEYLDIILADVYKAAGNRRIVFSSFDPDVCAMLSLKQNKYPVLFLCVGDTKKHTPYEDERTRTSITAVKFARGMELLGVNFNSEDLLRDPTPVSMAREFGLITFVWGDELVDKKNVDYFKKTLLVDGVIYDRIGEGEVRNSVFSLEKKMKAALFSTKRTPLPMKSPRSNSTSHLQHEDTSNESAKDGTMTNENSNGGGRKAQLPNGQPKTKSQHYHERETPKEWPEQKKSTSNTSSGVSSYLSDAVERKMRRNNSTTQSMDIATTTAFSEEPIHSSAVYGTANGCHSRCDNGVDNGYAFSTASTISTTTSFHNGSVVGPTSFIVGALTPLSSQDESDSNK